MSVPTTADNAEIFSRFLEGQHDGVDPEWLPEGQYARGLNVSSRGGKLRTRPRLQAVVKKLGLPPPFQGCAVYRWDSEDRLVLCSAGSVYVYKFSDGSLTLKYTFPTVDFKRAYFEQADRFFVVQNAVVTPENWPLILDGDQVYDNLTAQVYDSVSSSFKALKDMPNPESLRVPIGAAMAYAHNRLHVSVSRLWDTGKTSGTTGWINNLGRRFWVSGDVLKPDNAAEVLAFTENTYLSEGGAFSTPAEMGFINAMTVFRNANTGAGLGSLVVLARDGVAAYSVNLPRTTWKSSDIGQILFMRVGTESPAACIAINDDLVFRSAAPGIRTVRYTVSKEAGSSGSLSSVPISLEIQDPFTRDTRDTLPMVSSAWSDNRMLMTAVPDVSDGETRFRALVSLDTNVVGSMRGAPAPIYDGVWTGPLFLQVFRARVDALDENLVLLRSPDGSGQVSICRFTEGGDETPDCWVKTARKNFGSPVQFKELESLSAWVSGVGEGATLTAYYRPDGYSKWAPCNVIRFASAGSDSQGPLQLVPVQGYYNPRNGRPLNRGSAFQFCLRWTGNLVLERLEAYTHNVNMAAGGPQCAPVGATTESVLVGDDLDEYTVYEVPHAFYS